VEAVVADDFCSLLNHLIERHNLSTSSMRDLTEALLAGQLEDAEASAILVALRMKGETADEIAAAATVLRGHMVRLDLGRDDLLDTCGTGGDGAHTFNISTAAALVAAAAGVPVVKHGNRAVSSQSGSADVLSELGIELTGQPDHARRCLDRAGLAFCFAPHYHPILAQLGALRRRLRTRTLFNLVGPLANPAGAAYQLLGVGRRELLDPLAGALARLGTRRALVVWSTDGLDEVSLCAPTLVREVRENKIVEHEWSPDDFGLAPCRTADLHAENVAGSARLILAVFNGEALPARRVVVANAAAAIWVAGRAASLKEGAALADAAITDGRALLTLQKLRAGSE
jgi:anthranilate phosphoribosyltransferase